MHICIMRVNRVPKVDDVCMYVCMCACIYIRLFVHLRQY